ncbi:MAG: autotransporter-associated beta strand repeat-containing protein [Phycisphaerae bacterium]|nr:autotransporter-associated beta strand repeat-containing protein [Phycisphaerae bacterium]
MMVVRTLRAQAIVAVLFATAAFAGETWDGNGGDNDWSTNNNWNPNGEPPNDGTANIVMAGANRLGPNVDVDWDIRSLVFSNAAAGTFVISGGSGVSLGVGEGGIVNQSSEDHQVVNVPIDLNASQTWIASQGRLFIQSTIAGHPIIPRTLTVTGAFETLVYREITGNTSLTKNGSGTLRFVNASTNTYSGTTTVNAGTLALWHGTNGSIPGNLVIGDGFGSDTVRLDSADQISEAAGNTITVNSSGMLNLNGNNETIANLSINGGTVSGAGTLTVNGSISSGASSSSGTISGGTVNLGGAIKTITVSDGAAAVDLSINSLLSNGELTKAGSGVLRLSASGNEIYQGATVVNEGTLELNGPTGGATLPIIQGNLTVGDGVGTDVVRSMGGDQIDVFSLVTINSSGLLDMNGYTETCIALDLHGGSITTGATGQLYVQSDLHVYPSSKNATITGRVHVGTFDKLIVDDGAPVDDLLFDGRLNEFKKYGTGQMRVVGSTSLTSTDAVAVHEGTMVLARTAGGGIGDGLVMQSGSMVLAANEQIASDTTAALAVYGTLNLSGFNEIMNDLTLGGAGTVVTGGGMLVMRNLTLSGGTLNPSSDLVTINGTVKSLAQDDLPTSLIAGNVSIAAASRTFDVENGAAATDLEVALALGGTNSLSKTGAGTLMLSGAANTYSGTTTVSGGVLALGKSAVDGAVPGTLVVTGATVRSLANEQIGTSGSITLNAGGGLDLNGFTETIGSLVLNGGAVTTGAGTLIVTGSITQSASAVASISGRLDLGGGTRTITTNDVPVPVVDLDIPAQIVNGGITKQGAGALRLGGDSTFVAGLHHQAGGLLIAHDNALGIGTLTLAGGAIEADGGARNISNPVVVTSLSTVSGSSALTFGGSFTINLGAALFKSGSGTLTLAGPQTHASGAAMFATAGTVDFSSSATGGTLGISLSNAGTRVNFNTDQDLSTLVVNGGSARAGAASLLQVNTLNVDTDATVEFEIGGLIPGDEFAQLDVSGNAALAGILDITLVNGFEPQAGQSFVILTFGARSGAFEHVTGMYGLSILRCRTKREGQGFQ